MITEYQSKQLEKKWDDLLNRCKICKCRINREEGAYCLACGYNKFKTAQDRYYKGIKYG